MKSLSPLLQIELNFTDYRFALLCFITAFVITMVTIPLVMLMVNKYRLFDRPDSRKDHLLPTPTMGGIAIVAGMLFSIAFWFPFPFSGDLVTFFFSMSILLGVGIADDIKDLRARYKFMIEIALASLIALAGIRITTFGGLFGINELPIGSQYLFTILSIVGITNAFNLLDGIDGLAGGLSFMSLVTLGIFLTISGDKSYALIAFALAGGVFAFLYFNMNPARIFMGDTGSLILGFVIAILCTRLIQVNNTGSLPFLKNAPLFALGMVLIPVFDALRVFAFRIWRGRSPFDPDKTHIHHLLTNNNKFSHSTTSKFICFVHGFILLETYWLKEWRPEYILCVLIATMILITLIFYYIPSFKKHHPDPAKLKEYELN